MNGCPPEGDGNNGGAQQGTRHRRFVSAPSTLTSPTPNLSSPLPPQSPSAPRTTLFPSEHLPAPLIMSCHVQSDKKTNKIIVGGCSAVASLHSSLSSISVISIVFVALFLILLLPIQTSCSPLLVKRKSQTNPTPTSSTASTSQSSQITQSVSSPRAPLLTPHNTNNTITKAPKPNGRLARHIFSFGQNPQEKLPKLTILAILPEEHAPQIIRILRDAQSKWEVSGHSSFLPGSVGGSVRAPDIPLQINSEPANNDTESLLGNVCEWIAVHRPTLVLSLLDQKRNFYVQLVANSSDIPFVSLTQNYRSEVNSLLDDHRLEVDFRATLSSLFDRPEHRAQHWRTSVDDDLIALTSENVWDAQNQQDKFEQRLSLDPPIQTLADATFELLRSQFWFDAILIVDDSTLSDLFARRLRTLCRNNEEFDDAHRRQNRSRIDQSPYGYDESLIGMKNAHKQGRSRFLTLAEEYDFEFSDLDKIRNREIKKTQKRKSREASLLNVWKNLVIIRVSRSMPHKEFYLRMSEIQTTHRRVVLVHADLKTTERVVQTGRELDILSGAKIWMILDGLLEGAGGQLFSPELSTLSLPNGMLAMRSKRRALFDARLLESVVELAGKAALNHHRNHVAWKRLTATSSAFASSSAALSSSSPFSQHRHPSSSSSTLSSPPSYSSSLSSASSSSFLNSPLSASKCSSSNSSKDERFYRYSILSEMRKLSEPVLSRYRWTRRKPCGLFTGDSSSAPSQEVKAQNAAGLADDELENLIGESSLYRWIVPDFEVLNLVPAPRDMGGGLSTSVWRSVGNISLTETTIATIQYIGSDRVPDYVLYDRSNSEPANVTKAPMTGFEGVASFRPDMYMTNSGKHRFRVVTNIAPPFVIESTRLDNQTCLTGELCLKVETNQRDELIAIFTDFRSSHRVWEGKKYEVHCCAGIAIDLLNEISRDLHFDYDLYMVSDGLFGVNRNGWDGVTGDIVNDLAHLSFTAFSTTSSRVQAIDFSVPYFYSGVSCLAINSELTDVPLLAFLVPFSYELWAAIFASLFATAVAAAIYEWFSPFGLNPWGRQRTKNFSLASALWVMCSLLFSHLVAFKAPKSWPNKVLINVWGAFSVIFLATYTANIAAHFAGLFLEPEVNDFHDSSLMKRRTGTARSSASEGYLMEKYVELYRHSQRYKVDSFEQGLEELRTGKLEVLIGDTAILDYFRASDPNCNLRLLGDSIFDDAYAVGMQKGFPFRESISNLILKYNEYGFLDQLHRKWYGRVHCLDSSSLTKPKPLTVRAEAGVFLMLAVGIGIGVVILVLEHLVFKYILPALRKKNKDCFWKSPNLMFFSQKLYRFINTVELVSPHHSAKEIITNLREGQIASLFQKSVKRKAKEEARRRKSKSQFFEMIQEVRKVVQRQQQERSLQENEDDAENAPDNDEAGAFEIDEEVALNTESNVRLTKPSFSHQLPASDQNSKQNRASAIRFCKEPEIYGDPKKKITKNGKPTGNHCNIVQNRKLISNLKPRPKLSQSISNEDETTIGTSVDLPPLPPPPQARSSVHHLGSSAETRQRREMLKRSHLASNSFSLENIFFEGLLSEGVPHPKGRTEAKSARRILSFEDLSAIKKELSESSQESGEFGDEEPNTMVLLDYSSPSPSMGRSMVRSETDPLVMPSRQTSQQSQASARPYSSSLSYMERIGNRHLSHLSRDDILLLWRSSERELLGRLEATQQQNRALADEIAHLKQMARKPP